MNLELLFQFRHLINLEAINKVDDKELLFNKINLDYLLIETMLINKFRLLCDGFGY